MGRPREHDVDALIDRATALVVERGVHGLTLRELAKESGASNGAIYHAFGSRSGLVARAYLREAERFLVVQQELVEEALERDRDDRFGPVVAAAQAASVVAERSPTSASFLLLVRLDELLEKDVPDDLRERLRGLRRQVGTVLTRLAGLALGRDDALAVDAVRACVVDVPTGLLLRGGRLTDPHAVARVEAAVRGIMAAVPPDPRGV